MSRAKPPRCGHVIRDARTGSIVVNACGKPAGHSGSHLGGPQHARPALDHKPRHAAPERPYKPRHAKTEYEQPRLPRMPSKAPRRTISDPRAGETYGLGDYKRTTPQPPLGLVYKASRARRARADNARGKLR